MDAYQELTDNLQLDIQRLLLALDAQEQRPLNPLEQKILADALLGYTRKQMASRLGVSDDYIRDRLSSQLYPRLAHHLNVEKKAIVGNWALILNLLLHPDRGYRLRPAPLLSGDYLQCSFGRQIFLYGDLDVSRSQVEGTQFYQRGLYYQAARCFVEAYRGATSPMPETLIYLNNSLVDCLGSDGVEVQTIAVVVPLHYSQGQIATEILQGVAQLQSQINYFALSSDPDIAAILQQLFPRQPAQLFEPGAALKVLVVNDPNHLYDPYNQTAERLSAVAAELRIRAVIGHYSSEMTQKALKFYLRCGIPLVNASSTAEGLGKASPGERLGLFRLATPDAYNASCLVSFLAAGHSRGSVAIIYNQKSLYSCSYRQMVHRSLKAFPGLQLVDECDFLGGERRRLQRYLTRLQQRDVAIVIVIPDGGVDPSSLQNLGLVSRLASRHSTIAGPATFYHQAVLHWLGEQDWSVHRVPPRLFACVPWHVDRPGGAVGRAFCRLGKSLWGQDALSWRSATAFDAALVIVQALYQSPTSDLLRCMDNYYKQRQMTVTGATGPIQFLSSGDRRQPPATIVTVGTAKPETSLGESVWRWRVALSEPTATDVVSTADGWRSSV